MTNHLSPEYLKEALGHVSDHRKKLQVIKAVVEEVRKQPASVAGRPATLAESHRQVDLLKKSRVAASNPEVEAEEREIERLKSDITTTLRADHSMSAGHLSVEKTPQSTARKEIDTLRKGDAKEQYVKVGLAAAGLATVWTFFKRLWKGDGDKKQGLQNWLKRTGIAIAAAFGLLWALRSMGIKGAGGMEKSSAGAVDAGSAKPEAGKAEEGPVKKTQLPRRDAVEELLGAPIRVLILGGPEVEAGDGVDGARAYQVGYDAKKLTWNELKAELLRLYKEANGRCVFKLHRTGEGDNRIAEESANFVFPVRWLQEQRFRFTIDGKTPMTLHPVNAHPEREVPLPQGTDDEAYLRALRPAKIRIFSGDVREDPIITVPDIEQRITMEDLRYYCEITPGTKSVLLESDPDAPNVAACRKLITSWGLVFVQVPKTPPATGRKYVFIDQHSR